MKRLGTQRDRAVLFAGRNLSYREGEEAHTEDAWSRIKGTKTKQPKHNLA